MKPDERDLAYLWDMLDAARRIERLTEGLDYAAFLDNERTSLAVERLLENVGEAARLDAAQRTFKHPELWEGGKTADARPPDCLRWSAWTVAPPGSRPAGSRASRS